MGLQELGTPIFIGLMALMSELFSIRLKKECDYSRAFFSAHLTGFQIGLLAAYIIYNFI